MSEASEEVTSAEDAEKPVDEWAELDKLRGRKWAAEVLRRRRVLYDVYAASKKLADETKLAAASDLKNLRSFEAKLKPRMKNRRPLLLRQFHGLIQTLDGEIRIHTVRKVIDYQGVDMEKLLEELESSPRGRKAVIVKKSVGKDELKQLSMRYLHSLAPLKLWIGQMRYVSIKSTGEEDATNLVRERRKR